MEHPRDHIWQPLQVLQGVEGEEEVVAVVVVVVEQHALEVGQLELELEKKAPKS